MKLKTYNLPSIYASALINGDYSGLENADIELLKNWLAEMTKVFGCFRCVDADVENTYFAHTNVINHLGDNLCQFTFDVKN